MFHLPAGINARVLSDLKSSEVTLANCCCKRGNTGIDQGEITSSKSLDYRRFFNKRLLLEVGGFHELQSELLPVFPSRAQVVCILVDS